MDATAIPTRIPAASGDLSTAMLRGMGYLILGSRLTFDDALDSAVLSRAVRLMLDAEPILGCQFKERLLSAHWERCADLDSSPYFSVMNSRDPDTDSAAFHAEPLAADGPRLAVRLLRSETSDDLCMKVDHLVADGWAAKQLTYTLADYYSRVLEDSSFGPAPNLTPRPNGSELWRALTPEQRTAAGRAKMRPSPPKWRIPVSRGSGNALHIRRLTLNPGELASLKSYGKVRGATINDMLLTALLRSFARIAPPERDAALTPSITADCRRLVNEPALDRTCVLAGAVSVTIEHDPSDQFADSLGRVVAATGACRDTLWGVKFLERGPGRSYRLSQAMMTFVLGRMFRSDKFPPIFMNIGVLDDSRLRFGGLQPVAAHVSGSIPKGPGYGPTVSTYKDTLTVWMGNYEHDMAPEMTTRVLQGMRDELQLANAIGRA